MGGPLFMGLFGARYQMGIVLSPAPVAILIFFNTVINL